MVMDYFTHEKYKHLMDDNLIKSAIKNLTDVRNKMIEWIKVKYKNKRCSDCRSRNFEYKYNKVRCLECDKEEEIEVPAAKKSGIDNCRTLEQILKRNFSLLIGREKQKTIPTKKQLEELPITVSGFDTGEYKLNEIEFLNERYEKYIESVGDGELEPNDEFLIHALICQELTVKRLLRNEAINPNNVSSSDKKREMDLYISLAQELKSTKSTREGDSERGVIEQVLEEFDNKSISGILDEYYEEKKEREVVLGESKNRRLEHGNPY